MSPLNRQLSVDINQTYRNYLLVSSSGCISSLHKRNALLVFLSEDCFITFVSDWLEWKKLPFLTDKRRLVAIKPFWALHPGPLLCLLIRSRHIDGKLSYRILVWRCCLLPHLGCMTELLGVVKGHPQPIHKVFSLSWLSSIQGILRDWADVLTIWLQMAMVGGFAWERRVPWPSCHLLSQSPS